MFACTHLEGAKKAKDTLVLVRGDDGKLRAGRVQAFLSHATPDDTDASLEHQVSLAHVRWHKDVPEEQAQLHAELDCPVFGKGLEANAASGNMCLVRELLPYNVASYPYTRVHSGGGCE